MFFCIARYINSVHVYPEYPDLLLLFSLTQGLGKMLRFKLTIMDPAQSWLAAIQMRRAPPPRQKYHNWEFTVCLSRDELPQNNHSSNTRTHT